MDRFETIDAEVAKLAPIAPAGYFLALRLRGASPLMVFKTYPQAWIDTYMENSYMLRDPVTTWALTIGGTIRWSSPFLPDPFGIFRQAAEHGLKFGASIAHGPIGSLTLCSMARPDRELTDAEIAEARRIIVRLHDLTELPKSLTEAQKALLAVLSDGGGAAQAAAKLGLSEAAARAGIREVCAALFAPTPDEAVRRARDLKLL
jgi:LuxR family transcriptional regulator